MMDIKIIAITAMNRQRVIGKGMSIPWHISEDLKRFSTLTSGHTVLMGRKTYESLPSKFRPLPNRLNVVITNKSEELKVEEGVIVCKSPVDFVQSCLDENYSLSSNIIWIIGGERIYRSTINLWDEVYLTLVENDDEGDAYFPMFEKAFSLDYTQKREGYEFRHYVRKRM